MRIGREDMTKRLEVNVWGGEERREDRGRQTGRKVEGDFERKNSRRQT